jgi:broad specificity phosphatase PhoE
MKLYFVRHGQTVANAAQIYDGQRLNSPLNDTGKHQAKALVVPLQALDIQQIISSPLQRARETAEIIAESLGGLPIIYDDRLMEHDNGTLSGTPYRTMTSEESMAVEGAEPVDLFRARVSQAFLDAKSSQLNTLIVSHGGVFTQYITLRDRLPASDYWEIHDPENATINELTINW